MSQDDGFLSRWSRRKVQLARGQPGLAAEPDATTQVPAVAVRPAPQPAAPAQPAPPLAHAVLDQHGVLVDTTQAPAQPAGDDAESAPPPPPPTLEEAQRLTPDADFTRFVGRDVDPQVKNAALKNLFSDPQFNVMDGLDIYIDDYGKPDPLPPGMLERMTQSAFLGLFRKTPEEEAAARAQDGAPAPERESPAVATADPPGSESAPEPYPATPTDPLDPAPDEDPDLRLQRHDDAGRTGLGEGAEPDPGGQR